MFLVVKRFEKLIGLVDELLNSLAGRVHGLPGKQRANDRKGKRGGKPGNADPYQRTGDVAIAVFAPLTVHVNLAGLFLLRLRQVLWLH